MKIHAAVLELLYADITKTDMIKLLGTSLQLFVVNAPKMVMV
jgi:hypothetical protein